MTVSMSMAAMRSTSVWPEHEPDHAEHDAEE